VHQKKKMLRVLACFLLAASAFAAGSPRVSFAGHQVFRVTPGDEQQVRVVHAFQEEREDDLDFWMNAPHEPGFSMDVRVSPEDQQDVWNYFKNQGIPVEVSIPDIESLIQKEQAYTPEKGAACQDEYLTYDQMMAWVREVADKYSNICRLVKVGTSYEGRDLLAIEVNGRDNFNATAARAKKGFFMDGGIHAREWISPATNRWILRHILENYGSDSTVTEFVDKYQITIMPIFNADGYQYTHTTSRLWRKTRSPNSGSSCVGTDPNRNADGANWSGPGASNNPCSETYYGKSAFSEPEVKATWNYVKDLGNVEIYLNMHSYSQLLLQPWGYDTKAPPDQAEHKEAGKASVDAIKAVHGMTYRYGSTAVILYRASGGIADSLYNEGIVHSYVYELRDTGRYGFLLPASQICANSEEVWAGILEIVRVNNAHRP
jgi:murein tripeptide amidase MpaA